VRDPRETGDDLKRDLVGHGVDDSSRTVRRRLIDAGRPARKPVTKQLLTLQMRRKRLAKRYRHWTKDDWSKVLFSDESEFTVQGQRSQFVRRSLARVYDQAILINVLSTHKTNCFGDVSAHTVQGRCKQ